MNIYEHLDYRTVLAAKVAGRRAAGEPASFAKLAAAVRVQRSYLTHVMRGRASLSVDQLYVLCDELGIDEDGRAYVILLLDIERCGVPKRKQELETQRDEIRRSKTRRAAYDERPAAQVRVNVESDYYTDPLCSLVHMFMTIPTFRREPAKIAPRLQLSAARIVETLRTLERCGIVRLGAKGYELSQSALHLDKDAPLARAHGVSMRLRGMETRQRTADADDYFLTQTFSCDEATRAKIRARLLDFYKALADDVGAAPSKDVFHLNIDLFRV